MPRFFNLYNKIVILSFYSMIFITFAGCMRRNAQKKKEWNGKSWFSNGVERDEKNSINTPPCFDCFGYGCGSETICDAR